jgi:hypothetical protein
MARIANLSKTGQTAVLHDLGANVRGRTGHHRLTLADHVRLREGLPEDLTHEA